MTAATTRSTPVARAPARAQALRRFHAAGSDVAMPRPQSPAVESDDEVDHAARQPARGRPDNRAASPTFLGVPPMPTARGDRTIAQFLPLRRPLTEPHATNPQDRRRRGRP